MTLELRFFFLKYLECIHKICKMLLLLFKMRIYLSTNANEASRGCIGYAILMFGGGRMIIFRLGLEPSVLNLVVLLLLVFHIFSFQRWVILRILYYDSSINAKKTINAASNYFIRIHTQKVTYL